MQVRAFERYIPLMCLLGSDRNTLYWVFNNLYQNKMATIQI